jgi:hypothetical protein
MILRICHLGRFDPPAPGRVETPVQTLAWPVGTTVRPLPMGIHVSGLAAPVSSTQACEAQPRNELGERLWLEVGRVSHARRRLSSAGTTP